MPCATWIRESIAYKKINDVKESCVNELLEGPRSNDLRQGSNSYLASQARHPNQSATATQRRQRLVKHKRKIGRCTIERSALTFAIRSKQISSDGRLTFKLN